MTVIAGTIITHAPKDVPQINNDLRRLIMMKEIVDGVKSLGQELLGSREFSNIT
jgi:hypothetical protein